MRKYGIVGVKIKRDAKRNNMPYAFLQFEVLPSYPAVEAY